jgi:type IX secretion system PorP/SprF family membrane protein
MKTNNYYILFFVVLLFSTTIVKAQDLHFSQISETPLLRNPALAGLFTGDVRVQSVHRNQWNSVTTPYQTSSINAETKLSVGPNTDDFITIGGQILYDKAGATNFKSTHILPTLNYHKSLSPDKNKYISVGFMGGYVNRTIDRSKITTNNQWGSGGYDPNLPIGETFTNPGYKYWDLTAGVSFNSNIGQTDENNFYVGAALHHIHNPKVGFYNAGKTPLGHKYVANAGLKYYFSEDTYMTIQADHSIQGPNTETIGGIMYTKNLVNGVSELQYAIHAGMYMRYKDAAIPVIKLDYNPVSISFSYDINISTLKNASRGQGGFELSISYLAFKDKYNTSKEAVRCPRF